MSIVSVEDEVGGKMDKLGILFAGRASPRGRQGVRLMAVCLLRLVFAEMTRRVRGAIEEQCAVVVKRRDTSSDLK